MFNRREIIRNSVAGAALLTLPKIGSTEEKVKERELISQWIAVGNSSIHIGRSLGMKDQDKDCTIEVKFNSPHFTSHWESTAFYSLRDSSKFINESVNFPHLNHNEAEMRRKQLMDNIYRNGQCFYYCERVYWNNHAFVCQSWETT